MSLLHHHNLLFTTPFSSALSKTKSQETKFQESSTAPTIPPSQLFFSPTSETVASTSPPLPSPPQSSPPRSNPMSPSPSCAPSNWGFRSKSAAAVTITRAFLTSLTKLLSSLTFQFQTLRAEFWTGNPWARIFSGQFVAAGGASFGVILAYKIKLVPVPPVVTVFRVEKNYNENAVEAVSQYQQVIDKIDNDLFIRVLLQPITVNSTRSVRATFIGLFLGNADRLLPITDSQFPELGLKKPGCTEMPWIDSVLYWANFDNTSSPSVLLNRTPDSVNFLKRKSDYVKTPIPKEGLESLFKKMVEIGKVGLVFNSYGGIMNQIPESATPFPHRAGNIYKIQYSVNWKEEGEAADKNYINQIRELYSFMTPFVSNQPREAYLNYRDLDIGTSDNSRNSYEQGKVYGLKYFRPNNFDRLVKIKTIVDPDNVFRNEQSIPVLSAGGRKA
ncbi:UNVERIFIED_CONTAM: Berberine bridge enzyme-like 21 [Sesamum radiatum]|uniref:Berberine bridge enzyme-like 21 n=1 Tax=Sesamum radiatum TaxID=300843 RepID=A0AAW2K1D0_SESRA